MLVAIIICFIAICCVVSVVIFMNDTKHDLVIKFGDFIFSIKKHDKE